MKVSVVLSGRPSLTSWLVFGNEKIKMAKMSFAREDEFLRKFMHVGGDLWRNVLPEIV